MLLSRQQLHEIESILRVLARSSGGDGGVCPVGRPINDDVHTDDRLGVDELLDWKRNTSLAGYEA